MNSQNIHDVPEILKVQILNGLNPLDFEGGISDMDNTSPGRSLIDSYKLPVSVVLYRLEQNSLDGLDRHGKHVYAMDSGNEYLVSLKNPNAPSRVKIQSIIRKQVMKFVIMLQIPFDEALGIAHGVEGCAGLMFLDDMEKPDFFHIKTPRKKE